MSRDIDNSQDVMDSRDIIERIDDLETEVQGAYEDSQVESALIQTREEWIHSVLADEKHNMHETVREFKILSDLAEEASGYASDWRHGETLIRESYWVEYAEELVKDTEGLPKDLPSWIVIDWEKTAENLAVDYTTVDFDGVDYYIRCS